MHPKVFQRGKAVGIRAEQFSYWIGRNGVDSNFKNWGWLKFRELGVTQIFEWRVLGRGKWRCYQVELWTSLNVEEEYVQTGAGVVKDKEESQAAKWQDWKSWKNVKLLLMHIWKCTACSESNDPGGSLAAKLWNWNEAQFQRWEMNEKCLKIEFLSQVVT